MSRDTDHWAVASLLAARFGNEAVAEARNRAVTASDSGDRDAADIWREVEMTLAERPQQEV
ncbi:hypothetical protein [Arenibaculum pallidiluteum]|uniref:hypothetical protein n=1 Tax=Arenibaculum pallidiluteum TaxID=2812559 RepID=UPI001A95FB17|nr:hypothetical protein [Arenibaculum pallidiluteum]